MSWLRVFAFFKNCLASGFGGTVDFFFVWLVMILYSLMSSFKRRFLEFTERFYRDSVRHVEGEGLSIS